MVEDLLLGVGVGGTLLAIAAGQTQADEQPETVEFVVTSLDSDTGVNYDIHVEERPTRLGEQDVEDRLAADEDDSIIEQSDGTWVIRGTTGTASGQPPAYGDAFRWDVNSAALGILGFRASLSASEYTLRANGQEIDPTQLPQFDPPGPANGGIPGGGGGDVGPGVVGGGEGYDDTITASDADRTASTASELSGALSAASPGEIVFLDSDVSVGRQTFTVPAGVTLASDRGVGGSPGARIGTGSIGEFTTLAAQSDARITGLRVHGTRIGETVTHRDGIGGNEVAVRTKGTNVEIDNCDIGGYSERNIQIEPGAGDAHVHDNYIHDAPRGGLGYGVACGDTALIEYNYFNNNRHSVTCAKDAPGYTARYNHFGHKHVLHIIDAHAVFQGNCEWTRNIVENHRPRTWDNNANWGCAGYGGGVAGSIDITDNWFWSQTRDFKVTGGVSHSGNVYGTAGSHDPATIIPGHGGLESRPWHNEPVDWASATPDIRFR